MCDKKEDTNTKVAKMNHLSVLRKAWVDSSRGTKVLSGIFAGCSAASMGAALYTIDGFVKISDAVIENVTKLQNTPFGEVSFYDVAFANNGGNIAQVFAGAMLVYTCVLGASVCVERVRLNMLTERNPFQRAMVDKYSPK